MRWGHNFTLNYKGKNADQTQQEWFLDGPLPKIVLIGCISRSQGQKLDFQNATFKNFLVWNYKAQSFHIWYLAPSRVPLPKLLNYVPGVKIDPAQGGSHFYID